MAKPETLPAGGPQTPVGPSQTDLEDIQQAIIDQGAENAVAMTNMRMQLFAARRRIKELEAELARNGAKPEET